MLRMRTSQKYQRSANDITFVAQVQIELGCDSNHKTQHAVWKVQDRIS
jgi:hypothetical protein